MTDAHSRCAEHYDAFTNPPIVTGKGKGIGKTNFKIKNMGTANHTGNQGIIEHHGVMFMYNLFLEKNRKWLKQISGRPAQIYFKTKGPDLIVTNGLAPHM